MRTRWSWCRTTAAAVMMVGLLAAGCSTQGEDSADSPAATADDGASAATEPTNRRADSSTSAAEPLPAEELEPPSPTPQSTDPGGGGPATGASDLESRPGTSPADLGRSIVFVANVEVVVEDVPLAATRAKRTIAGLGGLVFGENTTIDDQARTTLEFKVLPEDFQEALNRLEGLGELQSQQISADDVTERVVDLQSRITTAEASVERLRGFLETATDAARVAELELQLLERETTLETLRGQLRTLQDQVDLATIFLTLTEPAPPAVEALGEYAVTFYEGDDGGARCPGAPELRVDEGATLTVCVEVVNVGSNPMVDIELYDNGLDLRPRDFSFIDGADAEPLEPGQTSIAWATAEVPAAGGSQVFVTAKAADADGDSLRINVDFFAVDDATLEIVADDSMPGFGDVLGRSWDVLRTAADVVVLVVAALIPFLWIAVLAWFGRRWWRRTNAERSELASGVPAPPTTPAPVSEEPLASSAAGDANGA